jgi:hypothetical protein
MTEEQKIRARAMVIAAITMLPDKEEISFFVGLNMDTPKLPAELKLRTTAIERYILDADKA